MADINTNRPGYKKTKIGWIPEEWEAVQFHELASFKNGLNYSKDDVGSGLKIIGVSDFQNHMSIRYDNLLQVNFKEKFSKEYLLKNEDLLFVRSNGNKDLIGRVIIILDCNEDISHSGFTIRARIKYKKFLPFLAVQFFSSPLVKKQFFSYGSGTNISNLSQDTLSGIFIPLPPLPEQHRIAAILSTWDSAIATLDQLIAKKKALKKGLMQQLLTGRLRFPEFVPAGGTRFKETKVGRVPEEWEVVNLIDLSEKIMVGIASSATHAYTDSGIPMFRNQNIKESGLDTQDLLFIEEKYELQHKNKRLRAGDVLTVRTGYPGVSAVVPVEFEGAQCFTSLITRPKKKYLDSLWLAFFINSPIGKRLILGAEAGGAQKNVNAGVLQKLKIPKIPLPEQRRIAETLSTCDDEIAALEKEKDRLQLQKKGLMQQLLTGAVRVKSE